MYHIVHNVFLVLLLKHNYYLWIPFKFKNCKHHLSDGNVLKVIKRFNDLVSCTLQINVLKHDIAIRVDIYVQF